MKRETIQKAYPLRLGAHFLSYNAKHPTKETVPLDACITTNYY